MNIPKFFPFSILIHSVQAWSHTRDLKHLSHHHYSSQLDIWSILSRTYFSLQSQEEILCPWFFGKQSDQIKSLSLQYLNYSLKQKYIKQMNFEVFNSNKRKNWVRVFLFPWHKFLQKETRGAWKRGKLFTLKLCFFTT